MLEHQTQPQQWLIIANGQPLPAAKLLQLAQDKKILVLDGAYEYVAKLNIVIDVLLGDFDSISHDLLRQAYHRVTTVVHVPEQQRTDLEKGILYLETCGVTTLYICAASGLRLDQTLYNLRLLKKLYQVARPIIFITETETIYYLENSSLLIEGKLNDGLAVLSFPAATVTSYGLTYEMTQLNLQFAKQESVSNSLKASEAQLIVAGAALIIHRTS